MDDLLTEGNYESDIKSGSHGENFQYEFALTLFLRMRTAGSRYRLAYEVKKADKFDDVVLIDDEQKEIHFIQVKHADAKDDEVKFIDVDALFPKAGKGKSNGDFDLCKYIKSYLIVRKNFQAKEESDQKFSQNYYVVTNKDLEGKKFQEWAEIRHTQQEGNEILQFPEPRTRQLKLIPTEKAIKELGKQINQDFLELERAIVELFKTGKVEPVLKNYSIPLKDILKIDKDKNCTFLDSFNSGGKQSSAKSLYNLKNKPNLKKQMKIKENFLQQNSRCKFLPPYVSDGEIEDFFVNSFTLLVGVPNNLRPAIDRELAMWMKGCIRPDIIGKVVRMDLDQMVLVLKRKFVELNAPCIDKNIDNSGLVSQTEERGNRINDVKKKKRRILKQSDIRNCLVEIFNSHEHFTKESENELQDIYINRNITYTVDEDSNSTIIDETDDCSSEANERENNFTEPIKRLISDTEFVEELRGPFKDCQHIVLVAEPGMGKTSLFQFLSFAVQKEQEVDVFLIYLSNLVPKLEQLKRIADLNDILRVLSGVLSEESCELIRTAPEKPDAECYSIVIFFDGFDEIHSKYTDRVIQLFDKLALKKSIQIIISSRMHVKQLLENKFKRKSMILQPFSADDQIRFLKTMWKVADEADPSFRNFSRQLLDRFHSSIPSKLHEVLGLPLMMRMLGEIHSDQFKLYSDATNTNFDQPIDFSNESFNIVHLYEQFVRKCFHIKLKQKYQHSGDLSDDELDSVTEGYMLEHQLLAMRLLDIEVSSNATKNTRFEKKYDQFKRRCEQESEKSLLVKVVNGKAQFLHQSYAEYFVAKYLCDNISEIESKHVIRIWSEHEVIRKLSLIKLGENEDLYDVVNTLCEKYKKIGDWACESGCLSLVSYLVSNCKSLSLGNLNTMLQVSACSGYVEICEYLIKNKADPNAANNSRNMALHLAAENGYVAVVDKLLKYNAQIDARQANGWTALHLAAAKGHDTIVDLLLRKGATVDANTIKTWTPLHLAAGYGHADVVDLLIQNGADVDAFPGGRWPEDRIKNLKQRFKLQFRSITDRFTDDEFKFSKDLRLVRQANAIPQGRCKWTALHLAVAEGHADVVELLIRKGANVNAQEPDDGYSLSWLTEKITDGFYEAAHSSGVLIANAEIRQKRTALHLAAQNGHLAIVKLLLNENALLDASTEYGWTALHWAAAKGHVDIVDLLIQKGANVNVQTKENSTALHLAAVNRHAPVVNLKLDKKAQIDASTQFGWTALHWAAAKGRHSIVQLLIDKGANVNAITNLNWTALHVAVVRELPRTTEVLLKNNPQINATTEYGMTALHLAAYKGDVTIATLLIGNGANIQARNEDKQTAFDVAVENDHVAVADLLSKSDDEFDVGMIGRIMAIGWTALNIRLNITFFLLKNTIKLHKRKKKTWKWLAECLLFILLLFYLIVLYCLFLIATVLIVLLVVYRIGYGDIEKERFEPLRGKMIYKHLTKLFSRSFYSKLAESSILCSARDWFFNSLVGVKSEGTKPQN